MTASVECDSVAALSWVAGVMDDAVDGHIDDLNELGSG
jgi:hypothetical protein